MRGIMVLAARVQSRLHADQLDGGGASGALDARQA